MDSTTVIKDLAALYEAAVERLRTDIAEYVRSGAPPSPERRSDGSYCYPELRVRYAGGPPPSDRIRSFGRLHQPGTYATTITRPDLFAGYLAEQLDFLIEDFDVAIETGLMLRLAFGRSWRQTEGLLGSIMDLLGLDLLVPDHTTFSRRSVDLGVATALKKASGPVHVVIDSSGLSGDAQE